MILSNFKPGLLFVLLYLMILPAFSNPKQDQRPNILLFFVDDMGYGELGCYGSKDLRTPHIDAIAANGIRCTSGYVTAPSCSPSRAGLLTGIYQQRFGHEINPEKQFRNSFGLPTGLNTIGDYLQAAGYKTGAIGKWDLGRNDAYNPINRGFDFFYGYLSGARHYWPMEKGSAHAMLSKGPGKVVKENNYLTYQLTKGAKEFIDSIQNQPFFLYIAFSAPHVPIEAPKEAIAANSHIKNNKRRTYAGMITALDNSVGKIMKKLKDSGLEENTLVLFISDNGSPAVNSNLKDYLETNNFPLKEGKGSLYEGGIRVPFIAQWKGGDLPKGKTIEYPVSTIDILPTFLIITGTYSQVDLPGLNLIPYFKNTLKTPVSRPLFWRYKGWCAVRFGDWKWVTNPKKKTTELYHLKTDPQEQKNLIDKYPDKTKELKNLWCQWNVKNTAPLWQTKKAKFYQKTYDAISASN